MFQKLINLAQCPPGKGIFVSRDGLELAVFHLQDPDRFAVTQNACPHASGNLSAGEVGRRTVTCPVHHWKFDLETGYCIGTDDVFLKRYACKTKGDALLVDLDQPLPLAPPPRFDF